MPYSPNAGFLEITPGDPAYRNSWGTGLNDGVIALVDDYTAGQTAKTIGGTGDVVLTYTDGAACEARASHFIFTGVLTGNRTIFWPVGHELNFSVSNQTTGAFTLTLAVGTGGSPAGSTIDIANGGAISNYRSDGTNVLARGSALGNSGVAPGSYTNASVTVNALGIVTAASSGPQPAVILAHGNVSTATPNFLSLDLSGYSAYTRIEIQVDGLSVASGSDVIQVRFSTNAGSTFISSGYTANTVVNGSHSSYVSNAQMETGMFCNTTVGSGMFSAELSGINQSFAASMRFSGSGSGAATVDASGFLGGTAGVDAVRFYFAGTNCASGIYRVIGYQ